MSTTNQYRVAKRGSVMLGKAGILKPGQLVPTTVTPEQIKTLLAERAIVPLDAPEPVMQKELLPKVGVSEAAFFDKKESVEVESGGPAPKTATAPALSNTPTPQPEAPAVAGLWNLDPNALIGKPIDELRQMVADRDPELEVKHLDEVELIALLSADSNESVKSQS